MFVVKVYCKIETSPWAITITKPVPEAFELPASDWPEKNFFWRISEEEQPSVSDVFLHDLDFLIDRHSCVARFTRKVSELMLTKPEKLHALTQLQETSALRLVFTADLLIQKKKNSGQSEAGNSNASGIGSVRVSAQGLVSILQSTFTTDILSTQPTAPGSPRMSLWS